MPKIRRTISFLLRAGLPICASRSGPGIRDDSGVEVNREVSIHYDPLISKLAAWGRTRDEAIDRLRRALDEYEVAGIKTTLPFFREIVRDEEFISGRLGYRVHFSFLRAPRQGQSTRGELDEQEIVETGHGADCRFHSLRKAAKSGVLESGQPGGYSKPLEDVRPQCVICGSRREPRSKEKGTKVVIRRLRRLHRLV